MSDRIQGTSGPRLGEGRLDLDARLGDLGEGKIQHEARYRAQQQPGRHPHYEENFTSRIAKFIMGLLRELGLAYPHQFVTPPPWATCFARQGRVTVAPSGYYDLTFKAPRKGWTVVECEIWPMDPLTADNLVLRHYFGTSQNSIDKSINPGTEAGIWKFRRIYLTNNRAYTSRLINLSAFTDLVVGFEYYGWEL